MEKFFCGGLTCEDLEGLSEEALLEWLEEHCFPGGEVCEECVGPRLEYHKKLCDCQNDDVKCDQDDDDDVDCADVIAYLSPVKHICVTRDEMIGLLCCFLDHVNEKGATQGCNLEFSGGCSGLKHCLETELAALDEEDKLFVPDLTPPEVDRLLACYGCDCCQDTPSTAHGAKYLDCDEDGVQVPFACDRDGDEDVDCDDFHSFLTDSITACLGGSATDWQKIDVGCAFIQGCAEAGTARCQLAALMLTCLERELCRALTQEEIDAIEACGGESCDLGNCCDTISKTGDAWGGGGTTASYSKCDGHIRCDQDCDGIVDCDDFRDFISESKARCNGNVDYTHKQVVALACAFLAEGQCGNEQLCGEILDCIKAYLTEEEDPNPEPTVAEVAAIADCMVCGQVCDQPTSGAKKGHGSSGCAGKSNPKTPQGVDAQSGHSTTQNTDLSVPTTGPGANLTRTYSSNPDLQAGCDTGEHWTLSTSQRADYDSGTNILTLSISAELRIEVDVSASAKVTDSVGGVDFWRVPGQTTQVVQRSLITMGTSTFAVWRLRDPGGTSIDFYRNPESGETASPAPNGLLGRIAAVRDTYTNNYQEYQYSTWAGLSGLPAPRLRKILVNPATSPPAATIEFTYSLETEGNQGKLRKVVEYRPDANGAAVPVRQVLYKYCGDLGLTTSADVGTAGDLTLVIESERVDPLPGASDSPWRERVTHYRYHGNTSSMGSSVLDGVAHQLKMVVQPEQVEFAASSYGVAVPTNTTVTAYAVQLLAINDGAAAWTGGTSVADLASQVFAKYETGAPFRVLEVWMQSGCGCGASGAPTKRTYAYNYDASLAGRTTLHVDETPGATPASPLRRFWYETYAPAGTGVHYLRSDAVEELDPSSVTTNRAWVNWYDYDSTSFVLLQERTPATFPNGIGTTSSFSYQPGTTGSAPAYAASPTVGLSRRYMYAATGDLYAYKRLTTIEVGQGASPSTWTLIEARAYGDADGAGSVWDSSNSKTYLLSRVRQYRTAAGTGASANDIQETRFFYGFTGTPAEQMMWAKTDVEAEIAAENGPGGWYSSCELFDSSGRTIWSVAADMAATKQDFAAPSGYYATDTGQPSVVTLNADTSSLGSSYFGLPTSGFGRSGSGGSLATTYRRDLLGRIQEVVSPGNVGSYTLRHMYQHPWLPMIPVYAEVTLPHQWAEGAQFPTAGAAQVIWRNAANREVGTSEYAVADFAYVRSSVDSWPMGVSSYGLGTELGRRVTGYRYNGLVEWQGYWTALVSSPTAAPFGGSHATYFYYDNVGRLLYKRAANDTATMYEYDVLDRVVRVSTDVMGTETDPAALTNWTATIEHCYDGGTTSSPAIGNGNLTSQTALISSGSDRTTAYTYDFRDRRIITQNPASPHELVVYDNLDRITARGLFSSVPSSMIATNRGLYVETAYSQRGLAFRERTGIDASDSHTPFLETHRWFDESGRIVGLWAPTSPGMKTTYDGLGRVVAIYVGDRRNDVAPGATGNYASVFASHASVVSDDVIYEERTPAYASSGVQTLSTSWKRAHNATAFGALSAYSGGNASSAVATYGAAFYDPALRPIRRVEYGTNLSDDWLRTGGPAPSLSSMPDWDTSGNQIVSEMAYDQKGRVDSVTDSTGRITKYAYDMADRRIATIENWDVSNPPTVTWSTGDGGFWDVDNISGVEPDVNRSTSFVYNGVGADVRLTAFNVPDGGSTVVPQHTDYHYGVAKGAGATDSALNSNDLLLCAEYPNSYSSLSGLGATLYAAYAYNLQGEATYMEEGKGVSLGSADFSSKHSYTRDALGRVTTDKVTAFGNGIATRINALAYVFDALGRLSTATSHSGYTNSGSPGTTTDMVEFSYTPLWQVSRIDQNPTRENTYTSGTPNGFTTRTTYAYDTQQLSGGTRNFTRLDSITYPDGSVEEIEYGSSSTSSDARLSRATALKLDSAALVNYERLGLNTFTKAGYAVPDVSLDRFRTETGSSSIGHYPGLDRFGRVRRQMWVDDAFTTGSGSYPNKPPIVSIKYAYTKASDRVSALDDRPGNGERFSGEYEYDGLHRLIEARMGIASGGAVPVGLGSQRWTESDGTVTLDALGNWRRSWTENEGDADYDDSTELDERTHDKINRIEGRELKGQGPSGTDLNVGPLQYDLASNLAEWKRRAGTSASTITTIHDAWNRLADVSVDSVLRCREAHNALFWRTYRLGDIRATLGATPALNPDGTFDQGRFMYYGQDWRLLEERVDDNFDFDAWKAGTYTASSINRTLQYVWGLRYIDDIVLHRLDANRDGDYVDGGDRTWHHATDAQFSTVCLLNSDATVAERIAYSAYGTARHRWPADVTGDGAVVVTGSGSDNDLAAVVAANGSTIAGGSPYRAEFDLDRDGDVDTADQSLIGGAKAALPSAQLSSVIAADGDNAVGWDGYLYSPETGLYDVRYRAYEPTLGRWMECDPAEYQDTNSLFIAMEASPLMWIDPLGLSCRCIGPPQTPKPTAEEKAAEQRKKARQAECETCDILVSAAKSDPRVKRITEALGKSDPCKKLNCGAPEIVCLSQLDQCTEEQKRFCNNSAKGSAFFDPKEGACGKIFVCCKKAQKVDQATMNNILAEEMIHLYDNCNGLSYSAPGVNGDCARCLCLEYRGALAAGKSGEDLVIDPVRTCLATKHCGMQSIPQDIRKQINQADRSKKDDMLRIYIQNIANEIAFSTKPAPAGTTRCRDLPQTWK